MKKLIRAIIFVVIFAVAGFNAYVAMDCGNDETQDSMGLSFWK